MRNLSTVCFSSGFFFSFLARTGHKIQFLFKTHTHTHRDLSSRGVNGLSFTETPANLLGFSHTTFCKVYTEWCKKLSSMRKQIYTILQHAYKVPFVSNSQLMRCVVAPALKALDCGQRIWVQAPSCLCWAPE